MLRHCTSCCCKSDPAQNRPAAVAAATLLPPAVYVLPPPAALLHTACPCVVAGCRPAPQDDGQSLEEFRTVLPSGRVRYERQRYYFCDPWGGLSLKNMIRSWVAVEVVPAVRGG